MDSLFAPETLSALISLSFMEILLGIDNVIFIIILTNRLPKDKRPMGLRLGLAMALVSRLLLLCGLSLLMGLTKTLFTVLDHGFSLKDVILIVGGLFLVAKATFEIHHKMEYHNDSKKDMDQKSKSSKTSIFILQIMIIDVVFSLDSVITAIGMVKQISVMICAMITAMFVMLISADFISGFIEKHPTLKILALSFLILIGFVLIVEGFGGHMAKGSIYFAMFFSFIVEMINMRYRSGKKTVYTGRV